MSRPATLRTVGDQITALLTGFLLTTAARELVARFTEEDRAACMATDVLLTETQWVSDFTTRLILDFLCSFTERFTLDHVAPELRREFSVPRVAFNYDVQAWIPKRFTLPVFHGDFVLLTPSDLLTKDDTWINRQDLFREFHNIPEAIGNDTLRAQIDDYFMRQLPKEPKDEDRGRAIDATIRQFPELVDYYIRYKEDHEEDAKRTSLKRVQYSERVFIDHAGELAHILAAETSFYQASWTTYAECLERIRFLKHVIEDRGGYRLFYVEGRPIERESDVHVMFDLVWLGSPSDVNREVNNGPGPADFTVSRGAADKTVIEFKLASNSQIKRNLEKQAEIYKQGARAQNTVKVIVFFSELQEAKIVGLLHDLKMEGAEALAGDSIAADAGINQAQLLEMARFCELLVAEVAKDRVQIGVQCASKLGAEANASVSASRETQPVLLDLVERVERFSKSRIESSSRRSGPQESEVVDDPVMQFLVLGLLARKQEKGIDEQRQVRQEGDVEGAVRVDDLPVDSEVVGEVKAGRGLPG